MLQYIVFVVVVVVVFTKNTSLNNISIMLAYASIYEITYYARNYAGIIRQPLATINFFIVAYVHTRHVHDVIVVLVRTHAHNE